MVLNPYTVEHDFDKAHVLMLCVYTCTQTHSCTVYPVVVSNIGTNMYGGNIGSLMLCVYTCTEAHSCTTENFAVKMILQLRPIAKIQHINAKIYVAMINELACTRVHTSRGKCLIDNYYTDGHPVIPGFPTTFFSHECQPL